MDTFEPNPITKLFPFAVAGFAWQVHGLMIGVILAVVYCGAVIASNINVMSRADGDFNWGRRIELRKWVIFGFFMIGVAISGASIGRI